MQTTNFSPMAHLLKEEFTQNIEFKLILCSARVSEEGGQVCKSVLCRTLFAIAVAGRTEMHCGIASCPKATPHKLHMLYSGLKMVGANTHPGTRLLSYLEMEQFLMTDGQTNTQTQTCELL